MEYPAQPPATVTPEENGWMDGVSIRIVKHASPDPKVTVLLESTTLQEGTFKGKDCAEFLQRLPAPAVKVRPVDTIHPACVGDGSDCGHAGQPPGAHLCYREHGAGCSCQTSPSIKDLKPFWIHR